jgi:hypothetical protein
MDICKHCGREISVTYDTSGNEVWIADTCSGHEPLGEERTFLVVYLTETDGDVVIEEMTAEQIRRASSIKLNTVWDFAIIEGRVVKDFGDKRLPRGWEG